MISYQNVHSSASGVTRGRHARTPEKILSRIIPIEMLVFLLLYIQWS